MYDSEACMKTVNDVTTGLKGLKYKKDKLQALKDNIQIRYRGFGGEDWQTNWSLGGKIDKQTGLKEGRSFQFQNWLKF